MKKSFSVFAIFCVMAVLIFSPAAFGQEQYRTEVSAEYLNMDVGSDMEVSSYGVSGEFFFEPVKTAGHPYAEAAFLERIGSVNAGVAMTDVEIAGVEGDGPMISAGVTYAKPGFPLSIQFQYTNADIDFDDVDVSMEIDAYELRVGNYFTNTLLAGIGYGYDKTETESPLGSSEEKDKTYELFAKYIHELGQGTELALEGSVARETTDDGGESLSNTDLAVAADYYFNRSLSVGAGIETNSGDNDADEGNTYTARVRYFITPQFSVAASYDKFAAGNDAGEDEKTLDLMVAARF